MSKERAVERIGIEPRVGRRIQRSLAGLATFARRQPLGAIGLVVIVASLLAAVLANWVAPYDPNVGTADDRLVGPSAKYFFGTDHQGRDQFSRIVYGTRISLMVSFFSIALGTGGGYLLGIISGYIGGKFDILFQRVMDAILAFPSLLLALVLVAVLSPGIDKVIIAIAIAYTPRAARVSRGVVLSLKENVYVDAARVIGASPTRIMLRHVLPNSLAPFLVLASVALGSAILTEAALSYLGLGVPPPHSSWGQMMSGAAQSFATIAPWLIIFPGVAIAVLVLGFNLFGDALRDVWDPKLRGR
ncbi:MAG: ABC transporter permease [Dehalococcoidia bacterium]|nr:ABC transporter permease [Dehalococcoidia bacterium]